MFRFRILKMLNIHPLIYEANTCYWKTYIDNEVLKFDCDRHKIKKTQEPQLSCIAKIRDNKGS